MRNKRHGRTKRKRRVKSVALSDMPETNEAIIMWKIDSPSI